MGIYGKHIVPRLIHWVLSKKAYSEIRERYLPKYASGTTVEIGFGSGLNLPFYHNVSHLYAIEPSETGLTMAQEAQKKLNPKLPFEFLCLDGQAIPLPNQSVDSVVSTWTFCTIPDPMQALAEIKRILKPEGRLLFIEHGLSPDRLVAILQNTFNPVQKCIGGGCHLNRDIEKIITDAGFDFDFVDKFYMKGPKLGSYLYAGVAKPK